MTDLEPYYADDRVIVYGGDCREILAHLTADGGDWADAVVCDPPYELKFMSKGWDGTGVAFDPETWKRCYEVLKPGGHLLAFGGSRTWHRMAVAIEDAGFELRDSIAWLYGNGFPKSMDVSKAIDKAARGVPQGGADPTSPNHGNYRTTTTEGKRWEGDSGRGYGAGGSRFLVAGAEGDSDTDHAAFGGVETACETACDAAKQWEGWGTALKPAFEPIVVARKPLGAKTVVANVLEHGTGALNIDATRVGTDGGARRGPDDLHARGPANAVLGAGLDLGNAAPKVPGLGRWPANVLLDGDMADVLDEQSGVMSKGDGTPRRLRRVESKGATTGTSLSGSTDGSLRNQDDAGTDYNDSGGASRFFPVFRYQAKAPAKERPKVDGVAHPTVKPLELMRWLIRLVTPPEGVIVDPFAGSGTTLEAAMLENIQAVGIEFDSSHLPLIMHRIDRQTPNG